MILDYARVTHVKSILQNLAETECLTERLKDDDLAQIKEVRPSIGLLGCADKKYFITSLRGREGLQTLFLEDGDDDDFSKMIRRAKLANQLGIAMQLTDHGVNGAKFALSLEGRKIGVFKAPWDGFFHFLNREIGWRDIKVDCLLIFKCICIFFKTIALSVYYLLVLIKEFTKKYTWGQASLLTHGKGDRELSEVIAYELDKKFGFQVVPQAKMVDMGEWSGAFIQFLEDYQSADSIQQTYFDLRNTLLVQQFQNMVVFDYLTGNLDCKSDNWFVKVENGKIQDIKRIDAGNSFMVRNPTSWHQYFNNHQYEWKQCPLAEAEFTQATKEKIAEITPYALDLFMNKYPEFFNNENRSLMHGRLRVLQEMDLGGISTPRELGAICKDEDFERFFGN